MQNNRVPCFLPESSRGVSGLWQTRAWNTVRNAIDPAIQVGVLLEVRLILRTIRCCRRYWQIARLYIEFDLEIVGEHILPIFELVVHLILAVIEEEQLVAPWICSRLLINRIMNNRKLESLEIDEIGEVPGCNHPSPDFVERSSLLRRQRY